MATIECAREIDALEAVTSGRWPDSCDGTLRAHVGECEICADVVSLTVAFQEEGALARRIARVPPSGVVWWRAQVRARQEAARAASRPIALALQVAVSIVVGSGLALLVAMPPWLRAVGLWLSGIAAAFDVAVPEAAFVIQRGAQLALAAWLVLAPVAVFFALGDD